MQVKQHCVRPEGQRSILSSGIPQGRRAKEGCCSDVTCDRAGGAMVPRVWRKQHKHSPPSMFRQPLPANTLDTGHLQGPAVWLSWVGGWAVLRRPDRAGQAGVI